MNKDWQKLIPELQRILDDSVESGEECGLQLAIYDTGKLVVDLAAGHDSPSGGSPVTQDSLFPVFSCGKGVMTTAMHRLVEKGMIDYDTRIGDLWPEFDCNGKQDVRLWHIMTHRAGLQSLPKYGHLHELADWKLMCNRLAATVPAWVPGGKCAYHSISFAWLMGEVASRVTGKPVRQVVIDEVLKPIGIEKDFFFGTSDEADKRFIPIDASRFPDGKHWCAEFINDALIRHAVIPS
ncbi:MAG: beta-lactamase family protein, partial [Victivallales bacterium]|nr:beta-lactamase family protein [Victivallales bacterium]